MRTTFQLNADHFQFYLEDPAIDHDTSLLWNTPIADGRLDILDGLLAIATARWGHDTAVTIEHQYSYPAPDDVEAWDVIVEASLRTLSGAVCLTTPEGDPTHAPALPLPPGWYRVRVHYGQLHSVTDELALSGADTYALVIWPSEPEPPCVLKGAPSTPPE